jgi:hypothetical protein
MVEQTGKAIFIAGLIVALAGLILWLSGSRLSWFGNLPGDIRIEKPNFRLFIPLTSMLLASVFISFILWLINRLKN